MKATLTVILWILSSVLWAEPSVKLANGHIIIVQADLENLWGTYYFAVSNQSGEEKPFDFSIRLPQESIDFQAGEGLQNEDLQLSDDGTLRVKTVFPSGLTLLGINFKVPTLGKSEALLTLTPSYGIPQLFFATTQVDLLKFQAPGFEDGLPPMLAGGRYQGVRGEAIEKGSAIHLRILGLPGSSRSSIKIVGLMTALTLLSLLFWLARKEIPARKGV